MPYKYLQGFYDISFFFYNPNIHPREEFEKRRDTFVELMRSEDLTFFVEEEYRAFDDWKAEMSTLSYPSRCVYCYAPRLEESAKRAKSLGIDFFSTSLLYSRYQQQEHIIEQGHALAKKYNLTFIDTDFRPYWNEGIQLSKEKKLYRQKYCGCSLPYTA